MTELRGIDLFCGAGGATKGYQRAGFTMTGVDNRPQPRYPGHFILADAMKFLEHGLWRGFDFMHLSPPCQRFTRAKHLRVAQGHPDHSVDLLTPVLAMMDQVTIPWVIENVPGAPLKGVTICGSHFGRLVDDEWQGLMVRRHRIFASNVELTAPGSCQHKAQGRPIGVYYRTGEDIPHGGRTARSVAEGSMAMGIDWMTWNELKESIPPAYTEHVGRQVLAAILSSAATGSSNDTSLAEGTEPGAKNAAS